MNAVLHASKIETRTFGQRLLEYVYTVSTLSDSEWQRVAKLIEEYMRIRVGSFVYFSVYRQNDLDDTSHLSTFYSSDAIRDGKSYTFNDGEKMQPSQLAYSYATSAPIWVTTRESCDSRSLRDVLDTNELHEHWSEDENIPLYAEFEGEIAVKTSVVLPFRDRSRARGIVEFAFASRIVPSGVSKQEAGTIREVIEKCFNLLQAGWENHSSTESALNMLSKSLQSYDWPVILKPTIFHAYPKTNEDVASGAPYDHSAVVHLTQKILREEYDSTISVIDWATDFKHGTVDADLVAALVAADFGVAHLTYFDANTEIDKCSFNQNVLFEAGMMHSLTGSKNSSMRAWFPIRENSEISEEIPFDIVGQNALIIPRDSGGQLDEEAFAELLRARLNEFSRIALETIVTG